MWPRIALIILIVAVILGGWFFHRTFKVVTRAEWQQISTKVDQLANARLPLIRYISGEESDEDTFRSAWTHFAEQVNRLNHEVFPKEKEE